MGTDASPPATGHQTVASPCPYAALRTASRAVTQLFDEALRPARLHSIEALTRTAVGVRRRSR